MEFDNPLKNLDLIKISFLQGPDSMSCVVSALAAWTEKGIPKKGTLIQLHEYLKDFMIKESWNGLGITRKDVKLIYKSFGMEYSGFCNEREFPANCILDFYYPKVETAHVTCILDNKIYDFVDCRSDENYWKSSGFYLESLDKTTEVEDFLEQLY